MKSLVSWGLFGIAALGVVYFLGQMYFIGKSSVLKLADAGNKRQVETGQKIYVENCASCHGVNLEGQPNWRSQLPAGGLPAPPHDETGHTWHHSDKLNFKYTKKGGQKIAPPGKKTICRDLKRNCLTIRFGRFSLTLKVNGLNKFANATLCEISHKCRYLNSV